MRAWLEARGYRLFLASEGGLRKVARPAGAEEWSPMVWALRPELHSARFTSAGVSIP
jgi:hypothetical protein